MSDSSMFKAAMASTEWYDVVCQGVVFRKAVVTAPDGTKTLVTVPKHDDLRVEYTAGTRDEPPVPLVSDRASFKGKGKSPKHQHVESFD